MHVALLEAEELYIEDESRVGRDELQATIMVSHVPHYMEALDDE